MYKEYFGFKELPFSIAPDPRYLYMSTHHQEALAHLLYGIKSGGFVLLTGDVGTGKTTISRCLLGQMPQNTDVAFILNPKMTVQELLATFCDELVINYPKGNTSVKVFVDRINEYLLDAYARSRKTVLIIEEAQNLSFDVLEQIRLLTNLETNQEKLLQIIMIGQPELRETLSRPEMKQLSQRITARYHIGPLERGEIASYINHRLMVAGVSTELFPENTMNAVYRYSKGIPRLINVICDRALLGAYAKGKKSVDKSIITDAAREVMGDTEQRKTENIIPQWIVAGLIVLAVIVALTSYAHFRSKPADQKNTMATTVSHESLNVQMLDENTVRESKDAAYKTLFETWGISGDIRNTGKECLQAKQYGLYCMNGLGNIQQIRRFNRPAVLKLFGKENEIFYAALTSIDDNNAILKVSGRTFTLSVEDIEKYWFGEFTLFWKTPPDYRSNIYPGYRGKVVQWLHDALEAAQGVTIENPKDVYNRELVRQVKKFQLTEGLLPDGVVGPKTIIHLKNAISSSEPVILAKEER
jgi:general secretion pathway protein A